MAAGQVVNGVTPRIDKQPVYPDPYLNTWGKQSLLSKMIRKRSIWRVSDS